MYSHLPSTYVNYMSLHMNLACGHEYKEIVRTCLYSSCTNTIRIGVPNTTPPQDRATCNAIVGLWRKKHRNGSWCKSISIAQVPHKWLVLSRHRNDAGRYMRQKPTHHSRVATLHTGCALISLSPQMWSVPRILTKCQECAKGMFWPESFQMRSLDHFQMQACGFRFILTRSALAHWLYLGVSVSPHFSRTHWTSDEHLHLLWSTCFSDSA